MSAPHRLVKWLVHFRDRTPNIKGATGLPRMCTERMAQDVYRAYGLGNSGSCTYLCSCCTKMHLRMSALHMLVKWLVHSRDRTPKVQDAF